MKNDGLQITELYLATAEPYFHTLDKENLFSSRKVISIGGQSGCGKTVLAYCFAEFARRRSLSPLVLNLDDYFHLPPKLNHQMRVQDIGWVGTGEVNLALLERHIADFKLGRMLYIPEMDYVNGIKEYRTEDSSVYDVLLVEGTYVTTLRGIDKRIFISLSYKQTLKARMQRARDVIDDFSNRVLEIEENIISEQGKKADIRIETLFSSAVS